MIVEIVIKKMFSVRVGKQLVEVVSNASRNFSTSQQVGTEKIP